MSISTKTGDHGKTNLPGKKRVSKSDLRVEAYGAIDELISIIGFARSICTDQAHSSRLKEIQRELFLVCSAVATPPSEEIPEITTSVIEKLTTDVHKLEAINGILSDWSIPGELPLTAALDVARAVCRRAERRVVQLRESGEKVADNVLAYLNRLSDFLWIAGRAIELAAGANASLRTDPGKRWTRAW